MPTFRIDKFSNHPPAGVFHSYDPATNEWLMMTRGFTFSDEKEFSETAENFCNLALSIVNFPPNEAHNVLLVVHADLSADLHINDFRVFANVLVKRGGKAGDIMYAKTIIPFLSLNVTPGSTIYTDGLKSFEGLSEAGFKHVPRIQPLRSALRKGAKSAVPLADRAIAIFSNGSSALITG